MRANRDGLCEVLVYGDYQVNFSWYLAIMLSVEISYILTMCAPDKCYSRNAPFSLNEISTWLLPSIIVDEDPGEL